MCMCVCVCLPIKESICVIFGHSMSNISAKQEYLLELISVAKTLFAVDFLK